MVQAEADKKDPRLASTTAQEAKEPGKWPGTRSDADRNPGGDEDLPTPSAPSAEGAHQPPSIIADVLTGAGACMLLFMCHPALQSWTGFHG